MNSPAYIFTRLDLASANLSFETMEMSIASCSICYDTLHDVPEGEINTPPAVSSLECGHIFHSFCVSTWFDNSVIKKCPVCQTCVVSSAKPMFPSFIPSSLIRDMQRELHEKTLAEVSWKNKFMAKDAECRGLRLRLELMYPPGRGQLEPQIPQAHNEIQKVPMDLSVRNPGSNVERQLPVLCERRLPVVGESVSPGRRQNTPPPRGRIVQRSMTMATTRIRPPIPFRSYEAPTATAATTTPTSIAGQSPPNRYTELRARILQRNTQLNTSVLRQPQFN